MAIAARNPGTFVVGGAVRDRLLGVESADIDLSVPGDPIAASERIAQEISCKVIVLDRGRGHVRLAVHAGQADQFIDVTGHSEGLEADLRKRDFTINAMAVPLEIWPGNDAGFRENVIDPSGGVADLESNVVRMTSVRALAADPVRLIRAVRFASQLGFDIDAGTATACLAMAGRAATTSPERVREELYAIFSNVRAARGVRLLDDLGLLRVLLPEVAEGKGIGQPPNHHYYDVFQHCMRTVAKIDVVLDSALTRLPDAHLPGSAAPGVAELGEHLDGVVGDGQSHRTLLRLAALVHDIAKPRCKSLDERERVRFLRHGEVGAGMVAGILDRLRCSRRVVSHVSTMVGHHLRPSQISSKGAAPSPRALVRYFSDLGAAAVDIVYLNMADFLAARGPMLSAADWRDYSAHCSVILSGGLEASAQSRPFLLLDGTEVMAEFGLQPGPQVGRLLEALRAAETTGTVQTRQDALQFLCRLV